MEYGGLWNGLFDSGSENEVEMNEGPETATNHTDVNPNMSKEEAKTLAYHQQRMMYARELASESAGFGHLNTMNRGNYAKKWKKRRRKKFNQLNLGPFLEAMDGISNTNGRVVIAMTNHPEHLDPAILRPGRFDIVINMKELGSKDLNEYMKYIFEDYSEITDKEMDECTAYILEHTIQTAIVEQAALERYGNSNKTLKQCVERVHKSFERLTSKSNED